MIALTRWEKCAPRNALATRWKFPLNAIATRRKILVYRVTESGSNLMSSVIFDRPPQFTCFSSDMSCFFGTWIIIKDDDAFFTKKFQNIIDIGHEYLFKCCPFFPFHLKQKISTVQIYSRSLRSRESCLLIFQVLPARTVTASGIKFKLSMNDF